MPKAAIFLDRDGVINRKAPENDYIKSVDELELLPGAARAIQLLYESGWTIVVVTNQRGVARGLMSQEALDRVNGAMVGALADDGAIVEGIYCCTHEKTDHCTCRKPRPGLLLQGAEELGLDLQRSWIVGDSESDVTAGITVGCRAVRILSTEPPLRVESRAEAVVDDLDAAVKYILSQAYTRDVGR